MPLIESLNERVYLIWGNHQPHSHQPNVGALVTDTETVLVDSGNSPRRARQIAIELAALGLPSVRTIIYTHHHWDHIFGAQVYHAPTIVAHEACYEQLQAWANKPISSTDALRHLHGESDATAMHSAVGDWRDFHLCLPTLTFGTSLTLLLDGLEIELSHVGGPHANDCLLVHLPQHGIVFCGDYALDAAAQPDSQRIAPLLDKSQTYLIDGHSPRCRTDEWRAWLRGSPYP